MTEPFWWCEYDWSQTDDALTYIGASLNSFWHLDLENNILNQVASQANAAQAFLISKFTWNHF